MTALDIITRNGDLVISSETIAEGTENQHKNVLQLIRTYREDLEDFGRVESQTRPFDTAGGTQEREVFYLNEPQATLILTYMRNMDRIRTFKKALVRAFFDMARQVAPVAELTRLQILELAMESEHRAIAEGARADQAEAHVAAIHNAKGLPIRNFVRKYFPDVKETDIFTTLYSKHMLISDPRGRWSDKQQKRIPGPTHMHPYAVGKQFFELAEEEDTTGRMHLKTKVRRDAELHLVAWLETQGFTAGIERETHLRAVNS